MNLSFLTSALLVVSVHADLQRDVSAASSAASVLKGRVDNWSSRNGLLGALGIQGYFPTLSRAVNSVSKDVSSIQGSDIDPESINGFVASVSGLLEALTSKAQDFSAVGASGIVRSDLTQLGAPASDIVRGIVHALGDDCEKVALLTSALEQIDARFSAANSAYNAPQISFVKPSC